LFASSPQSLKKNSLRSSCSSKIGSVHPFCTRHTHTLMPTESYVVDHILELQFFGTKTLQHVDQKQLQIILNSKDNLQKLGALQNRAKAWVFQKFIQGFVNKETNCGCIACVARSLLQREHLRCAGSLRSLSCVSSSNTTRDFSCLAKSCEEAWTKLLPRLKICTATSEFAYLLSERNRMIFCKRNTHL